MAVPTYTKAGAKATTAAKLDNVIADAKPKNYDLLHQAYMSHLANGRENLAIVKSRGLVRGGGKKPWRQKGTGRARVGSSRNPIWRGGGAVTAPTGQENYAKDMPLKAKRLAMRQALFLKADAKKLIVLEDFDVKDGKTASANKVLNALPVSGWTVLVVSDKTDVIQRATNNLPMVMLVHAPYLNVFDALNADYLVMTKSALASITERLAKEVRHG
jgi:large subunit ribosomal protein L4